MRPVTGVLLFLLVAAPWHIAAWRASGPEFTNEYIIRQHLARFRGGDTPHNAPFWFFIPGFLVGFFPLSLFVPAALLERKQGLAASDETERGGIASSARLLLKIWIVVVFVMFSASGSKLISYILPMYPPAALLAGDWCVRAMEGERGMRSLRRGGAVAFGLCGLALCVLILHGPVIGLIEAQTHRPIRLDQIPYGTLQWAAHLFEALALGTGAFLALMWARRPRPAFGALAAGMALFTGIAVAEGLPLLNASLVAPLQKMAALGGQEATGRNVPLALYLGPPRRPSALFYLPDGLAGARGSENQHFVVEIMDPKDAYGNIDAFLARNPHAVVVTEVRRVDHLLSEQNMRVVGRAGQWHVLTR